PAFPRDLDGDGLFDWPCVDDACKGIAGQYGIGFGTGAGFTIPSTLADNQLDFNPNSFFPYGYRSRVSQDQAPFIASLNRDGAFLPPVITYRDTVDLNGDGFADDYDVPLDGQGLDTGVVNVRYWTVQDDDPPGLLKVVYNGMGATTRFRYGRSTDPNLVVMNQTAPDYAAGWVGPNGSNQWIQPSLASPLWVVKQLEVRAFTNAPPSITSYQFKDPVSMGSDPFDGLEAPPAPERRFRGFQAVVTTLPQNADETFNAQTFERRSYRFSPDGLEDYK